MTVYIVTVKLKQDPLHDPHSKKPGRCEVSPCCTDATGAHHSFLDAGTSAGAVQEKWQACGFCVTRTEEVQQSFVFDEPEFTRWARHVT